MSMTNIKMVQDIFTMANQYKVHRHRSVKFSMTSNDHVTNILRSRRHVFVIFVENKTKLVARASYRTTDHS